VNKNNHALRLNVGFILPLSVGSSREFVFEEEELKIPPDLEVKNLNGVARVTRTPSGLLVQVKMQAKTASECVRCLTEFDQPLAIEFTELYAFASHPISDSGLILPESGYINLAPLVREYLLLDMPINPLCRQDCKGLCRVCGENLNEKPAHTHEESSIDPRLAVLKDLFKEG
jgi:uncharacterized protein